MALIMLTEQQSSHYKLIHITHHGAHDNKSYVAIDFRFMRKAAETVDSLRKRCIQLELPRTGIMVALARVASSMIRSAAAGSRGL